MPARRPAVYIMTNQPFGTLYVGVTSNLPQRAWQHRTGQLPGFTDCYGLKRLVWHEAHETMDSAIRREKTLKRWRRDWKIDLVSGANPDWDDLFETLLPHW